MANEEKQEKDNFWLIIGVLIAAVVVGVILFKKRETSTVQYEAWEEIRQEEAAARNR
ncbi:LPXTG cell wall anchor domain-containing protein [Methylohalobius crimeensis]|uniref:LPXTG cell wall anchor domain-containing protein n=1 Tax=Methylohalobius crimeensis TaxID=244365 RepID=UPI0003B525E1|nr:LPXTG cell wall anchor domain-containing protein [Methylohalobius crimeensis]